MNDPNPKGSDDVDVDHDQTGRGCLAPTVTACVAGRPLGWRPCEDCMQWAARHALCAYVAMPVRAKVACMTAGVVFLLDVDNTLLDGDRFVADLHAHLDGAFGSALAQRYWAIFDAMRSDSGYVDYLGALQRFRFELGASGAQTAQLLSASFFLMDYPFAERLYPGALDAIARLSTLGTTVILSDGDIVYQPRKLQRSGLWDAVGGRALICVHKETALDAVQAQYPARHYVMVEDKLRILTAMKALWTDRLTTVFVRQGHYALDTTAVAAQPAADVTIDRIEQLADVDFTSLSLRRRGISMP